MNKDMPARVEVRSEGAGLRWLVQVEEETGASALDPLPSGMFRIICRPMAESDVLLPNADDVAIMEKGVFCPGPGHGIVLTPSRGGGVEVRATPIR